MYGMVNQALQGMIVGRFGQAAWEAVKDASGVRAEVFISNSAYPDDITYQLVGAASRILGLSVERILHDFGRHWVLHTAQEGYGELMRAGGRNLPEFLKNLPGFHTRISLIFPQLRPPRFRNFKVTENSLVLCYSSDRPGLVPFVEGLLEGLGEMFGTPVRVTREAALNQEEDSHFFRVEWEAQPA